MKKMILGLAALVMVTCSFAQPFPGEHHKGNRHGIEDRYHGPGLEKLNLSEAQKQQLKALNADFRKQMKELNSKENIMVKEQRDQRAALAKAHKNKFNDLLTSEQKNTLAQMKSDHDKKRAAMTEQRLVKMKEKLSLSDAQLASIKSSQENTHNKMEAIMKDDKIERSGKRQQLMALREEMKNNIDQVLTPEQKTKMESLRKDRQQKMKSFKDYHMENDKAK